MIDAFSIDDLKGYKLSTEALIRSAISRLLRGLMSESDKFALPAYKEIHAVGTLAVPLIEQELRRADLSDTKHLESTRGIIGLASLLHDIDEIASNRFIDSALAGDCNAGIAGSLRSIRRYSNANYRRSKFDETEIFEENTLDPKLDATGHVRNWLTEVPNEDLLDISRIYIVEEKPLFDFSGQYMPYLHVVTLVWINVPALPKFGNAFLRLGLKRTLFHEIGHHVHRHREFGLVSSQEKEADTYANARFARRHPILTAFVWSIRALIRPDLRLCKRTAGSRPPHNAH